MWNFVVHTHFFSAAKGSRNHLNIFVNQIFLLQLSSPLRGITHHAADVLRFGTVNEKPAFKVAVDNRSAGCIFSGGKNLTKILPSWKPRCPSWKVVWEDGWEMSSSPEGKSNKATVQWIFVLDRLHMDESGSEISHC